MSLRDRKKKRIMQQINSVARELFLSKGYLGTTLDEIAGRCEIGVGTLYNYYESKADIFLSIMSDELSEPGDDTGIDHDEDDTVIDRVLRHIWDLAKPLQLNSKDLWRELIAVAMGSQMNNLLPRLLQLDMQCIRKLEGLLDNEKRRKALPAELCSHVAANVIYSVFMTQFMLYVFDKDMSFEAMKLNIESQTRFVLRT